MPLHNQWKEGYLKEDSFYSVVGQMNLMLMFNSHRVKLANKNPIK